MADIRFEIVKHLGTLSVNEKGWTRELNLVSWNGAEPKYDLRQWAPDHEKMGKGIGMSAEELSALGALIHSLQLDAAAGPEAVPPVGMPERAPERDEAPAPKRTRAKRAADPAGTGEQAAPSAATAPRRTTKTGRGRATESISAPASLLDLCAATEPQPIAEERPAPERAGKQPPKAALPAQPVEYTARRLTPHLQAELGKLTGALQRGRTGTVDANTFVACVLVGALERLTEPKYLSLCRDIANAIPFELDYSSDEALYRSRERLFRAALERHGFTERQSAACVPELHHRYFLQLIDTAERAEKQLRTRGVQSVSSDDMDTVDLAYILARLPEQPGREALRAELGLTSPALRQRMVAWFADRIVPELGGSAPDHSAGAAYAALTDPTELLWLNEALGEDPERLRAALAEAKGRRTAAGRCNAIRRQLPFDRLKALAERLV